MLPDKEQFNYKDVTIAGDPCWLITPKELGVTWTDDNYRYRSAIVLQSTGEIISHSLPKFVNFGEQPDFHPWDNEWPIQGTFKYDGSLIICSIYNGEFICRSRGTVDVMQLESGREILDLIKRHNVEDVLRASSYGIDGGITFVFEYISPNHVIVLREFDEPTLIFLGEIYNSDGYIVPRWLLEHTAKEMGLKMPEIYKWDSISDCIADVKAWEGKEGVVLQSPDGQILKKIKSDHYRKLHSFMFGMKSLDNVLDVFLTCKTPKYSEFFQYIATTMDHEIAENCKDHILTITVAYSKYLEHIDKIKHFVETLPSDFSRKEKALAIQYHYQQWKENVAFLILDNREISDKLITNAIKQIING